MAVEDDRSSPARRDPGGGDEGRFTRRRFLRGGAVAGAGGSLLLKTSRSALGREATPEGVLRCGIIGYGDAGTSLQRASGALKGIVRFPAVMDIWARSRRAGVSIIAATGQGVGDGGQRCTAYDDLEAMLAAEELDAVIVATPTVFHRRQTELAMEAGLHVYCEGPMSNSLADARAMVALQRRTGNLLQIGYQRRSNPRYRHARDEIVHGEQLLGWIGQAEAHWHRSYAASIPREIPVARDVLPDEVLVENGYSKGGQGMYEFRNWRYFRPFGLGLIGDLASHQIDLFNWFFDAVPTSVQASGGIDYLCPDFLMRSTTREIEEAIRSTRSSKRRAKLEGELARYREVERWRSDDCVDNLMAIYEYETPRARWNTEGGDEREEGLVSRALYRTCSTSSSQSVYETFMGENGTLGISQLANVDRLHREPHAPCWDWALEEGKGLLEEQRQVHPRSLQLNPDFEAIQGFGILPLSATYSRFLPVYNLPDRVQTREMPQTAHLRNFFQTVRDGGSQDDLNCPAVEGFRTLATVLKMEEAMSKRTTVDFAPGDFEA